MMNQIQYNMMVIAEVYIQKPEDPIFKKFSPTAMANIKSLAQSIKKSTSSDEKEKKEKRRKRK